MADSRNGPQFLELRSDDGSHFAASVILLESRPPFEDTITPTTATTATTRFRTQSQPPLQRQQDTLQDTVMPTTATKQRQS